METTCTSMAHSELGVNDEIWRSTDVLVGKELSPVPDELEIKSLADAKGSKLGIFLCDSIFETLVPGSCPSA